MENEAVANVDAQDQPLVEDPAIVNVDNQDVNSDAESNHSTVGQDMEPEQGFQRVDVDPPPERRYPERDRRLKRYDDYHYYADIAIACCVKSIPQALKSPEKNQWETAMKEEYQSLMDNNTWTLVNRPTGGNVVKCKWVLRKKETDRGVRFKARLVARGFTQVEGIDYYETYSPVVRLSTIRTMIAVSCQLDFSIHHVDVTTAFLHGELNETISTRP